MDRQRAIKILNDTFNSDFDINRFTIFVKELFNNFSVNVKNWSVWKEYLDYIESYQLLGSYKDNSKKIVDVLVVKLKKSSSRDRARTMQRNFVAKYLSNADKDSALVAFYGDDPQDWRFSFVKMEYNRIRDETGKVINVKELTPAKRYSFLVGVNEPNHTCGSQFLKLIMEEEINPSLLEIETAFSIDNVTKEFFNEYKELFLELEESLQKVISKDKHVKEEFEDKGISSVDFAKKLLGQIVFIYFLQKKGWLGVVKDEQGRFKKWGTGSKKFLRTLFDKDIVPYNNFFNDILEPLFYEALATERDDDYYSRFKCKIPFLNGGLFEPLNDYDWAGTEIVLDNNIFDRILSTFDRFNFTVKEDEPLEKEVAVDPEMLGKVFENLLTVKDRKSKGAFYTPREIVHYMCQQSLINYLETNTSIERKDIEKFIQLGDLALDMIIKEQEQIKKYGKSYDIKEEYTLPKSIKDNYKEIDRLFREIKVVDPAVGSGAFPLGMMSEIVKARSVLSIYFNEKRSDYDLKREIIENCIYGVDIESSAVDITKLRFWLSLIVDELDMQNIKPLPNLDHKIMCGNSLLEEFEGVKLFDEKLLGEVKKDVSFEVKAIEKDIAEFYKKKGDIVRGNLNGSSIKEVENEIKKLERKKKKLLEAPKDTSRNLTLDEATQNRIKESQRKLTELKKLQKQFFNEQNRKIKKQLRADIDKIEWELVEETLKEQGNEDAMQKLEQYKKNKSKPFFLWKLYFAEVFQRENPGFDVVIANPPYVGHKGGQKELFQELKNTEFGRRFNNERMDLFYYFFHLGLDLGRIKSEVAFITTNYYVTADSAIKLRTDFKNRTSIRKLVNFNELKIFDSARGQHNMLTFVTKIKEDIFCEVYSTNRTGVATPRILLDILSKTDKETVYYDLKQDEIYEGNMNYIRLYYGKLKNKKTIDEILEKLKINSNELIRLCNISQGMVSGIDRISKKHIKKIPAFSNNEGEGVYVIDLETKKSIGESPLLRPWFKNSDISKYKVNEENSLWVIQAYTDLNMDKYPNIKSHFEKYKQAIKSRNYDSGELSKAKRLGKWWAMSSSRREFDFSKPKIVSPQRSYNNTFAYTEKEWTASADVYFITLKDINYNLKYILALLNSKLYYLWLYFRGKRKGEMLELYLTPLSEVLIKEISPEQQKPFISLVDQILSITKGDDYLDNPDKKAKVKRLEKEIDQLVYKLYELTPEEIKIVEEFNKK